MIQEKEFELLKRNWSQELNHLNRAIEFFESNYQSENYLTANYPVHHRSALDKIRCGVALIRIETGRYERIAWENIHRNAIESETRVICKCYLYDDLWNTLFGQAKLITYYS